MNILNILKDKPKGTKLYSPICGECELEETFMSIINVKNRNGCILKFYEDGTYYTDGECLLFPSKEMRNWSKFAWKKGDVLTHINNEIKVYFNQWVDDTYTHFYAKQIDLVGCGRMCDTSNYTLASKEDTKSFIAETEKIFGGNKFNPKTLKIEEKKKEHEFKPFEKILGRDANYDSWNADFFEYFSEGAMHPYRCIRSMWKQCIPYEGNEHLLNTANSPTE